MRKSIEKLIKLSNENLVFDPDIYIAGELQQKIIQAIESLPAKCRDVFVMSRYKGLNNEEIAIEMNISRRTVETHIHNALKHLRVRLKEYAPMLLIPCLFSQIFF